MRLDFKRICLWDDLDNCHCSHILGARFFGHASARVAVALLDLLWHREVGGLLERGAVALVDQGRKRAV